MEVCCRWTLIFILRLSVWLRTELSRWWKHVIYSIPVMLCFARHSKFIKSYGIFACNPLFSLECIVLEIIWLIQRQIFGIPFWFLLFSFNSLSLGNETEMKISFSRNYGCYFEGLRWMTRKMCSLSFFEIYAVYTDTEMWKWFWHVLIYLYFIAE
jgi:hypothetical protein